MTIPTSEVLNAGGIYKCFVAPDMVTRGKWQQAEKYGERSENV